MPYCLAKRFANEALHPIKKNLEIFLPHVTKTTNYRSLSSHLHKERATKQGGRLLFCGADRLYKGLKNNDP